MIAPRRSLLSLLWPTWLCLVALLFADCGGGGGGTNGNAETQDAGSVTLVIDTAAGDQALVQFQLVAVAMETMQGDVTGNLLAQVQLVTFDDPSGESNGVQLPDVPGGDYAAVHLMFAPGSGLALLEDGTTAAVDGPLSLRIAMDGGLLHDERFANWLLLGHDAVPLSQLAGAWNWSPTLSARADGELVRLSGLCDAVSVADGLAVSTPRHGNAPLFLEFAADSQYTAEDGSSYSDQGAFLADATPDQSIQVDGELLRDGRVRVDRVAYRRDGDEPRLIGRVRKIDASAERFELRVHAVADQGHHEIFSQHEDVMVQASGAVLRRPDGQALTFADLRSGQLAKVEWTERTTDDEGIEVFVASEVELLVGSAGGLHSQWHGGVDSVDVGAGTLVIVPCTGGGTGGGGHHHSIMIAGMPVAAATVVVDAHTKLQRNVNGHCWPISLADVQPGTDRVWVCGTVTGAAQITADRVRVSAAD